MEELSFKVARIYYDNPKIGHVTRKFLILKINELKQNKFFFKFDFLKKYRRSFISELLKMKFIY